MKKIINNKYFLSIFVLLLYLFLIDNCYILYYVFAFPDEIENQILHYYEWYFILTILVINKFYLLPLVYLILCKYVTNPSIHQFLHNIRYKWLYKIGILILSLIITIVWGTLLLEKLLHEPYTLENIIGGGQLVCLATPFIGGYQALLILYLYWFIYDVVFEKIGFLKKFKQQMNICFNRLQNHTNE